ncbi:MAG: hypothetical protein SFV23_20545, partial [Planctomycetaceae bacterium]|nr:hypothetical protein [Planctomycetaceae bacterium]
MKQSQREAFGEQGITSGEPLELIGHGDRSEGVAFPGGRITTVGLTAAADSLESEPPLRST